MRNSKFSCIPSSHIRLLHAQQRKGLVGICRKDVKIFCFGNLWRNYNDMEIWKVKQRKDFCDENRVFERSCVSVLHICLLTCQSRQNLSIKLAKTLISSQKWDLNIKSVANLQWRIPMMSQQNIYAIESPWTGKKNPSLNNVQQFKFRQSRRGLLRQQLNGARGKWKVKNFIISTFHRQHRERERELLREQKKKLFFLYKMSIIFFPRLISAAARVNETKNLLTLEHEQTRYE